MRIKINGFTFEDTDIKGMCPRDGNLLFDSPNMIGEVHVSDEDLQAFMAGMWGIGFCPKGLHYYPWTLPQFADRLNVSESNPFGDLFAGTIDKLPDEV